MKNRRSRLRIESILAGAQLPALPQSAITLFQLAQSPENGPAEFAVAIESDPGLASQLLKFVNSSYFGLGQEVTGIKLAVTLIGTQAIKNFSLWSAIFHLMPNPKCGYFDLNGLRQDSLQRGLFARVMSQLLGEAEREDLFAAALLQDIALPLLAKELPEEYDKLVQARRGGHIRLSELEQERFGWTHAKAAGFLARHWNLPRQFAKLIERHTQFGDLVRKGATAGEVVVSLSALLPSSHDSTWHEREPFVDAFCRLTGKDRSALTPLLAEVDKLFEEFATLLKLGSPSRTLLASLEDPATTPA